MSNNNVAGTVAGFAIVGGFLAYAFFGRQDEMRKIRQAEHDFEVSKLRLSMSVLEDPNAAQRVKYHHYPLYTETLAKIRKLEKKLGLPEANYDLSDAAFA